MHVPEAAVGVAAAVAVGVEAGFEKLNAGVLVEVAGVVAAAAGVLEKRLGVVDAVVVVTGVPGLFNENKEPGAEGAVVAGGVAVPGVVVVAAGVDVENKLGVVVEVGAAVAGVAEKREVGAGFG